MQIEAYKSLAYDLKDLDGDKGVVVAYANVYNNRDSDGDISAPGSFDKTVKENFKRIRVLKDHDPKILIGVPLEIDTKDSYGLLTKTQFNMDKAISRDMFTDIKLMHENGQNAELSIGHKALKRDLKNKSIITEYYLGEYSFLSNWASNPLSTVQAIKSAKSSDDVMNLLQKMYNLPYSDERLKKIELLLKSLSNEPDNTSTQIDKPIIADAFKEFKQLLTNK